MNVERMGGLMVTATTKGAAMAYRLELIVIPVTDMDRAKGFYDELAPGHAVTCGTAEQRKCGVKSFRRGLESRDLGVDDTMEAFRRGRHDELERDRRQRCTPADSLNECIVAGGPIRHDQNLAHAGSSCIDCH
jgi:hypothetical protein